MKINQSVLRAVLAFSGLSCALIAEEPLIINQGETTSEVPLKKDSFPEQLRETQSADIPEIEPDAPVAGEYKPDWRRYETNNPFGLLPGLDEEIEMRRTAVTKTEREYLETLSTQTTTEERRKAMLDLAALYERRNNNPKVAAVYEKFIEYLPHDSLVPELYIRLGFIYRELGAFDQSLSKFYSVLNASLAIDRSRLEVYRQLSLKAQLEIADTHYMMGEYEQSAKYFKRALRLPLPEKDRQQITFKLAYSNYLLNEHTKVITGLKGFIDKYPENSLVPESHFLLANSYKRLNQPRQAVAETLKLLQHDNVRNSQNPAVWLYWKKRTGNQLANEFYEQMDYVNALKIYQAMARQSDYPDWQWPVIYQIGLCYERLNMLPLARDAYEMLLESPKSPADGSPLEVSDNLLALRSQAEWRIEHLNWLESSDRSLVRILETDTTTTEE